MLQTGPSWEEEACKLISFDGDGIIRGYTHSTEDFIGTPLGTYSPNTWIKGKIEYEVLNASTIRVTYWISDIFKGSELFPSLSYENELAYISLVAPEGTVWFDDIKVTWCYFQQTANLSFSA